MTGEGGERNYGPARCWAHLRCFLGVLTWVLSLGQWWGGWVGVHSCLKCPCPPLPWKGGGNCSAHGDGTGAGFGASFSFCVAVHPRWSMSLSIITQIQDQPCARGATVPTAAGTRSPGARVAVEAKCGVTG